MGPSWPNCSLVLCTWPMKSMKPSPDFGTPCSGQSVNWNCRTVRDWPSCNGGGPAAPLRSAAVTAGFPPALASGPAFRHRPTPPSSSPLVRCCPLTSRHPELLCPPPVQREPPRHAVRRLSLSSFTTHGCHPRRIQQYPSTDSPVPCPANPVGPPRTAPSAATDSCSAVLRCSAVRSSAFATAGNVSTDPPVRPRQSLPPSHPYLHDAPSPLPTAVGPPRPRCSQATARTLCHVPPHPAFSAATQSSTDLLLPGDTPLAPSRTAPWALFPREQRGTRSTVGPARDTALSSPLWW